MKTIHTAAAFDGWFTGLKGPQAARRIQVRIDRAEDDNFGDCQKPRQPKNSTTPSGVCNNSGAPHEQAYRQQL
ncbi:MAG: hypothetical protein K2X65_07995 [Burkholderiaceae bacterium]|nr:hypothetical protein [Burkholderiaceae bacterium]